MQLVCIYWVVFQKFDQFDKYFYCRTSWKFCKFCHLRERNGKYEITFGRLQMNDSTRMPIGITCLFCRSNSRITEKSWTERKVFELLPLFKAKVEIKRTFRCNEIIQFVSWELEHCIEFFHLLNLYVLFQSMLVLVKLL